MEDTMDHSENPLNFESGEFRQALGTFATGVTVIAATAPDGRKAGVTANSFTSVSLKPPLILWCLASSSESLAVFQSASHFSVNILAANQLQLSINFARGQNDKFKSVSFNEGRGAAPLLTGCATWLQCQTAGQYEMGDHWVFIGEVVAFETTGKETLLYHHGEYAMSLPLPDGSSGVVARLKHDIPADDSLYSLLLRAIHAYQERYESRQQELINNSYEARALVLLHDNPGLTVSGLAQQMQIPRTEIEEMLHDMEVRKLLEPWRGTKGEVSLSAEGLSKARQLHELAKQHEVDILAQVGAENSESFRRALKQIIQWGI